MSSVVMYAIARCSLVGGCFASRRWAASCHRSRSSAYVSSAASPSAGRHAATSAAHRRSAVCASAMPEDDSRPSPSCSTPPNRGVMFSTSFCRPSPAHVVEGGVVGPQVGGLSALPVLVLRPASPGARLCQSSFSALSVLVLRPVSPVWPPCRFWFSALDFAARRFVNRVDVCEVAAAPLTPPAGDFEDSAPLEDAVAIVDAIDGEAGPSCDISASDLCA